MEQNFTEFIFVALVAFQAIMFGVFGCLYSVYSSHMALLTRENPIPAVICKTLKGLCIVLVAILQFTTILSLICLWLVTPHSMYEVIVSLGLAICILAIAGVTLVIGWKM